MNSDWGIDSSWSLFLDRDGVINKRNFKGYILSYNDFVFQDGVLKAIAQFKNKFRYIFIVTNQQCVGKNFLSIEKLNSIHEQMLDEISNNSGSITNIYCATELNGPKMCRRKPLPSMGLNAKKDYPNINFSKSIMIGDTDSDIKFGKNLGMKTVCLKSKEIINESPDLFCDSLLEFCNLL